MYQFVPVNATRRVSVSFYSAAAFFGMSHAGQGAVLSGTTEATEIIRSVDNIWLHA